MMYVFNESSVIQIYITLQGNLSALINFVNLGILFLIMMRPVMVLFFIRNLSEFVCPMNGIF